MDEATPDAKLDAPGKHDFDIEIEGLARNFIVHIPATYDRKKPLPLVLAFHGAGGDAEKAATITGWDRKADRENFIVAFPNGMPPSPDRPPSFLRNPQYWNAGSKRGAQAIVPGVSNIPKAPDDVLFSSTIIDTIDKNYNLDLTRVYATGFSNGAAMSWRLGVDLCDRIAAIGPVAGYLALPDPRPAKPVPAIVIACLNDPLIPIDGGVVKDIWSRQERNRPSVREVVKKYAVSCGCLPEPVSRLEVDGVTKITYQPQDTGAEVIFYTIADAGHSYPGGREFLSERIIGKATDKLNATHVIWEFFAQHQQ